MLRRNAVAENSTDGFKIYIFQLFVNFPFLFAVVSVAIISVIFPMIIFIGVIFTVQTFHLLRMFLAVCLLRFPPVLRVLTVVLLTVVMLLAALRNIPLVPQAVLLEAVALERLLFLVGVRGGGKREFDDHLRGIPIMTGANRNFSVRDNFLVCFSVAARVYTLLCTALFSAEKRVSDKNMVKYLINVYWVPTKASVKLLGRAMEISKFLKENCQFFFC